MTRLRDAFDSFICLATVAIITSSAGCANQSTVGLTTDWGVGVGLAPAGGELATFSARGYALEMGLRSDGSRFRWFGTLGGRELEELTSRLQNEVLDFRHIGEMGVGLGLKFDSDWLGFVERTSIGFGETRVGTRTSSATETSGLPYDRQSHRYLVQQLHAVFSAALAEALLQAEAGVDLHFIRQDAGSPLPLPKMILIPVVGLSGTMTKVPDSILGSVIGAFLLIGVAFSG